MIRKRTLLAPTTIYEVDLNLDNDCMTSKFPPQEVHARKEFYDSLRGNRAVVYYLELTGDNEAYPVHRRDS